MYRKGDLSTRGSQISCAAAGMDRRGGCRKEREGRRGRRIPLAKRENKRELLNALLKRALTGNSGGIRSIAFPVEAASSY